MQPMSLCFVEPIIDFVNLRPFAEFVLRSTGKDLPKKEWNRLLDGVLGSNVELGERFSFNLTPEVEDTYTTFALELGHDYHKVHIQAYCPDWIALKMGTAAELMSIFKLVPLPD